MKDRFNLNLFHLDQKSEEKYLVAQEITDEVLNATSLYIELLPVDFPKDTSSKHRKELESNWIQLLPTLNKITKLVLRHNGNQELFEAACKLKNLDHLRLWSSKVEDISSIKNLQNLKSLALDSCNKLTDLTPLLQLKKLELLSIENCFAISNYEIIAKLPHLRGLKINGDAFAPKNLRIKTLSPFTKLTKLKHLDLTSTSIIDDSYESILDLKSLERFDTTITIPKTIREKIKSQHKNLKAGFFMDYDFENKRFYDGKEW